MEQIITIIFFQFFGFLFGKECLYSTDNSTLIFCSDTNLTNITQLSLINSDLTEMPDLYDNHQLKTLHLDNNRIELINRNYSFIEYLYLTSNHIYALHLINLSYPNLQLLDLSHNPIEHIAEEFFSNQQFPQLKILKLINALKHINPYLIDNRLLSFSALTNLNELYLNENNFEEFSCSKNISYIQWKLPSSIQKISFGRNKLRSLDENCLAQICNLTELELHSNNLNELINRNSTFPYLSKVQLEDNVFTSVPSSFLRAAKQLTELNLSTNRLNFKEMKTTKQNVFPVTLKSLYLNGLTDDLTCAALKNLIELEQLHLADLTATRLERCIFKKLTKLKTVGE